MKKMFFVELDGKGLTLNVKVKDSTIKKIAKELDGAELTEENLQNKSRTYRWLMEQIANAVVSQKVTIKKEAPDDNKTI